MDYLAKHPIVIKIDTKQEASFQDVIDISLLELFNNMWKQEIQAVIGKNIDDGKKIPPYLSYFNLYFGYNNSNTINRITMRKRNNPYRIFDHVKFDPKAFKNLVIILEEPGAFTAQKLANSNSLSYIVNDDEQQILGIIDNNNKNFKSLCTAYTKSVLTDSSSSSISYYTLSRVGYSRPIIKNQQENFRLLCGAYNKSVALQKTVVDNRHKPY
eukprot:289496_1